jgi:phage-related baseplate assembly protein
MELRFDGDDLKALAVSCTVPAIVVLTGDDDVEDYAIMMPNDGMAVSWDSESGVTNPVAGDVITKAYITHGSSAGTKEVAVGIATD